MREQPVPWLWYPVSSYTDSYQMPLRSNAHLVDAEVPLPTSLLLSEILDCIITHCLRQQFLWLRHKMVKAVMIYRGTSLCKFLVSYWHR